MTSIDYTSQIPAKSLADIKRRNESALKAAEDPAWSLDQAEFDRAMLCAEVDRLTSVMQAAASTAMELGAHAGMDVIVGYLGDAGMLPPVAVQADPQDGEA